MTPDRRPAHAPADRAAPAATLARHAGRHRRDHAPDARRAVSAGPALAHGLEFCSLVEQCRLERLERPRLIELVGILEESAIQEAGDLFHRRLPPGPRTMKLFRQTAMECLRLHPRFVPERSWAERWRLIKGAIAFARGKGTVPVFRLPFARRRSSPWSGRWATWTRRCCARSRCCSKRWSLRCGMRS